MKGMFALALALAIGAAAAGQSKAPGAEYVGHWHGTWDGAGAGEFDLVLEQATGGALGGKVAVTTDGGNYTADLQAISFEGSAMRAKYTFPLDESAEVAVAGSFEAASAKGTWSLHPKGQDTEIAGGTWTVARQ
jgi:hypothetical protein